MRRRCDTRVDEPENHQRSKFRFVMRRTDRSGQRQAANMRTAAWRLLARRAQSRRLRAAASWTYTVQQEMYDARVCMGCPSAYITSSISTTDNLFARAEYVLSLGQDSSTQQHSSSLALGFRQVHGAYRAPSWMMPSLLDMFRSACESINEQMKHESYTGLLRECAGSSRLRRV